MASRLFRLMTATNLVAAAIAVGVVIAPPIEEELARRRHKKRVLQAARRSRAALASGNDDSSTGGSAAAVDSGAMSATNDLHDTPAAEAGANDAHTTAPGPLVYPDRWPTRATLIALASNPRRREWVDAIRRAKEFRFQCEMCPRGLEPVRALEAFMRHVRAIWAEAKAEDSALEPALGAALERLALVHARMAYRVKQEGGGLTETLEEALLDPTVVAGMQRRRRAQVSQRSRVRVWKVLDGINVKVGVLWEEGDIGKGTSPRGHMLRWSVAFKCSMCHCLPYPCTPVVICLGLLTFWR